LALIIFSISCEKEKDNTDTSGNPQLKTIAMVNVIDTTATCSGFMITTGGATLKATGVCWNTSEKPTVDNFKVDAVVNDKAMFYGYITGLARLTKYYVRAYTSVENKEIVYGEELSFYTTASLPKISSVSSAPYAATLDSGFVVITGGNVSFTGGDTIEITGRGVCWATKEHPTIDNDKLANKDYLNPSYVSVVTKLKPHTKYYMRSYAQNTDVKSIGVAYGEEFSFTTGVGYPILDATKVDSLTKVSAYFKTKVLGTGDTAMIARGFCFSKLENPSIENDIIYTDNNLTVDTFAFKISGLDTGATYHVRAFATNGFGTNYSKDKKFTTIANKMTLYVPGAYQNWSPATALTITNMEDSPIVEGYIYMPTAGKFKFTSAPDWEHTNYGPGDTPGTLSTDNDAGDLIASTPGYYFMNVNVPELTYTATLTSWAFIGDDTGWKDSTMTFDPATNLWSITLDLTAKKFKFRANGSWDINYGSAAADGTLQFNAGDILIAEAGNYTIVLDLSHPTEYTYTLTKNK